MKRKKVNLVAPFSISSRDLCSRLGKTSEFPAGSGSAPTSQVQAAWPGLCWSAVILAVRGSPCFWTPSGRAVVPVYWQSSKKGDESDGPKDYFQSVVLCYYHCFTLWLLQPVSSLPAMHKNQRAQMEGQDLCHKSKLPLISQAG